MLISFRQWEINDNIQQDIDKSLAKKGLQKGLQKRLANLLLGNLKHYYSQRYVYMVSFSGYIYLEQYFRSSCGASEKNNDKN